MVGTLRHSAMRRRWPNVMLPFGLLSLSHLSLLVLAEEASEPFLVAAQNSKALSLPHVCILTSACHIRITNQLDVVSTTLTKYFTLRHIFYITTFLLLFVLDLYNVDQPTRFGKKYVVRVD